MAMQTSLPFTFYQKSFMLLFSVLCIHTNTLPVNKATNLFRYMMWADAISSLAMSLYTSVLVGMPKGLLRAIIIINEIFENTQIVLGMWLMLLLVLILYGRNASLVNSKVALVGSIAASMYYVFALFYAEPGSLIMFSASSLMILITVFKISLAVSAGYELLRLKNIKHGHDSRSNFQAVYRQKYLANELFLLMLYVFLVFDSFVFLPHVLVDIPAFDKWYKEMIILKKLTKVLYSIRPMVNFILLSFYAHIKSQRQGSPPRRRHQASVLNEASEETIDTLQHNDSFNQYSYSSTGANVQANSTLYPEYRSQEHIRSSRVITLLRELTAEPNSEEQTPLLSQENEALHSVRLNVSHADGSYIDLNGDPTSQRDAVADTLRELGVTSSFLAVEKAEKGIGDDEIPNIDPQSLKTHEASGFTTCISIKCVVGSAGSSSSSV